MEPIHAKFRVQTTGEHLRDTTIYSGLTGIVRRGKTDDNVNLKRLTHLLDYYHQFREWYEVFSTFKSDCNPEHVTWIKNFKLNFKVA